MAFRRRSTESQDAADFCDTGSEPRRRSQEFDELRDSAEESNEAKDKEEKKSDRDQSEDDRKRRFDERDDGKQDDRRGWDERKNDAWDSNKNEAWDDRRENWNERKNNWNDRRDGWNDRRDNWNDRRDNWNKRRAENWEEFRRDRRGVDERDTRRGNDDNGTRDDRNGRERARERRRYSPENRDRDDFRERDDYRGRDWRNSPQRDRSRKRWSPGRRMSPNRDRSPGTANSFPDPSTHQTGEWICRCGALNFKRRFTCYRQHCGASRNEAVSVVPADRISTPGINKRPLNAPIPPAQTYTLEDVPRLAAYSAQVYAANAQEQASYLKYYTTYYTQQLSATQPQQPSSDLDKVNAAAAVAQSAISQLQARTPISAPPTGTDNRMYQVPDVSTYLYDETSGYYYDPLTGLYYDPNTQYYFNNQINQYLYWDITKYTYVLASTLQQGAGQTSAAPIPTTNPTTSAEAPQPEEKKKTGEKTDKVKVAKKIAKDMERWAKTLNQKKEMAKTGMIPETNNISSGASSGSADIGFSVLEQRVPVNSAPAVQPPLPPSTLVPSYGGGSDSSGDETEGIIDWNKLACLLCKRQFPSREVLEKHQLMSELHRQNLDALRGKKGLNDKRDSSYRDRAAERRMKYGEDDTPIIRAPRPEPVVSSIPQEIGEENIGNKLLQKMGWTAGQGLGKEGQGRIGPVEATGGGLGRKRGIYTAGPGETYSGCVKKLTMARYQDLVGSEGNS